MSTLAKSDLFFFISSISVVVVALAFVVAAAYVAYAANEVRRFVQKISGEVDALKERIQSARKRAIFPFKFLRKLLSKISSSLWHDE